ncbi:MAG: Rieske 2Fe-2S domain-containing protein [bacterium]
MSGSPLQTRRRFLDLLLGASVIGWLGAVFYPIARYLRPPASAGATVSSVNVGKVSDFPPDSGRIFKFGSKPGILVRQANGEFRAFLATCTHLQCIVQYRSDLGVIWCACHNGRYDLNGKNIAGPPPRPLGELKVDVSNGDVFVSRVG